MDPELDELRREFLTEAQDKVREMQAALEGDGLDRVAYIAHQLKGSGGSYGYQRISSEAAEIEKVVESIEGNGSQSVAPAIRQHVINLREEIDLRTRELA